MNRTMNAAAVLDREESPALTERQVRALERELTGELRRLESRPGAESMTKQLLGALGRMASGTYGVCAGCRSPIGYERLEVIPETIWCRRCSLPGGTGHTPERADSRR
jgi:RNA polymerase-binding transcription factor DksA